MIKSFSTTRRSEVGTLFLFYLLAHFGLFFLPDALYWDDWILYQATPEILLDTFRQAGSMFNVAGYLHYVLLSLGPWSYRVLTFLLMFSSGFFLLEITRRIEWIDTETRVLLAILFVLLPFNIARVALIDFPYTLCYLFFFFAWYLIDKNRLASLLLFFLSFNTNSLLVFYVLPIAYAFALSGAWRGLKNWFSFIRYHVFFILLPFVYYYLKVKHFKPYGFYSGYNESLDFGFIVPSLKLQVADALQSIRLDYFVTLVMFPVAALLVSGFVLDSVPSHYRIRRSIGLVLIGIGSLLLAGVPYWVIGYVPTFSEWTSRHQLLFPLGGALVFSGFISMVRIRLARVLVVGALIAWCLSYWIGHYYDLFVDWNKQEQFVRQLRANPNIKSSSLLIVEDNTVDLNAIKRKYRFYEWNCLVEHALGGGRMFAVEVAQLPSYSSGMLDKYFSQHYCADGHVRTSLSSATYLRIDFADQKENMNLLRSLWPLRQIKISIETPRV